MTFLCFCGYNEPQTHQISTDKVNPLLNQMRYVRDNRTNLCYAVIVSSSYGSYGIVNMACVPCTEEVLRQIK